MYYNAKAAEESAVLNLAYKLCAAVRTAPKACGIDPIETTILTGEDQEHAAAMRKTGVIFATGQAAARLGILGGHKMIRRIPLFVSGKPAFSGRA